MPSAMLATTRLVEAMARFGPIELRVIAIYGWPQNRANHRQLNQELLELALQRVQVSGVPTLLGGDLNTDVTALPVWERFRELGFVEAFQFAQARLGVTLPPTCRNSTRHDTFIIPTLLQPLLCKAEVMSDAHLFAAHALMVLTFSLPHAYPARLQWNMPKSWIQYSPDKATVQAAYNASRPLLQQKLAQSQSVKDADAAFLMWAQDNEQAVSLAITKAHRCDPQCQPLPALPKMARGRCEPRQRKWRRVPQAARCARDGDYTPPEEAASVRTRMLVKQVRRLQTFVSGRTKYGTAPNEALCSQLQQEWSAICRAKGFLPSFPQWLLNVAHFQTFWWELPPLEWVRDVLAYTRFHCDAVVRQVAKHRAQLAKFSARWDAKHAGHRKAFASIKEAPHPPFSALPVCEVRQLTISQVVDGQHAWYEANMAQYLRHHCLADTELGQVRILDDRPNNDGGTDILLQSTDVRGPLPWPPQLRLEQRTVACSPEELTREFHEFWHCIWNRDRGSARTEAKMWEAALADLPQLPEEATPVQLVHADLRNWKEAIRKMRPNKATGYCGFTVKELKALPDESILDVSSIFSQATVLGYPRHLAQAKVAVLAKRSLPESMSHGRPIVIFATLYRLWASVAAQSILRHWSKWLPWSIRGSLPNRDARDISYALEAMIEAALSNDEPLAGFSVDIVKCFNQLPRLPLRALLSHLGFPQDVLALWFNFLSSTERAPNFLGSLGSGLASATGVPEGDPLSVVAQVAICWLLVKRTELETCQTFTFVDNFSWVAKSEVGLQSTLQRALQFCSAWSLPIDWQKSFGWGTTARLRRWWTDKAPSHLPAGGSLQLVDAAKDLGVSYKFRKGLGWQDLGQRLAEGHRRLKCVAEEPRPIDQKIRLVQGGIWPQALYGHESQLLPLGVLNNLRAGAVRAVWGKAKSLAVPLASAMACEGLHDPEVYLLTQALLQLQKLLYNWPELGQATLQLACLFQAKTGRPFGPGTALARMLQRAGWTLSREASLKGPANLWLDLCSDAPRVIRRQVVQAWAALTPQKVARRNGLHDLLPPAVEDFQQVCRHFDPPQVRQLGLLFFGGFQSKAAQPMWDPFEDSACRFCGALHTKHHRLFACPAQAEVRRPFQTVLDWIQEQLPRWTHCAVPVLRLIFQTRRVSPSPCPLSLVDGYQLPVCNFYSDGTCANPHIAAARHAAWAVVLDCAPNLDPNQLLLYLETNHHAPQSYHVVSQGLVPGVQSIDRAETLALLQVCVMAKQMPHVSCVGFSDCQFALDLVGNWDGVAWRQSGRPPGLHHDLFQLLQVDGVPKNLQLRKVKAHADIQKAPLDEVRHLLGNSVADEAAKLARLNDLSVVLDLVHDICEWHARQREAFRIFLQYNLELTRQVAMLDKQHDTTGPAVERAKLCTTDELAFAWLGNSTGVPEG